MTKEELCESGEAKKKAVIHREWITQVDRPWMRQRLCAVTATVICVTREAPLVVSHPITRTSVHSQGHSRVGPNFCTQNFQVAKEIHQGSSKIESKLVASCWIHIQGRQCVHFTFVPLNPKLSVRQKST